jgi:hypothetical protein
MTPHTLTNAATGKQVKSTNGKMYFRNDALLCFGIISHIDSLKDEGETEIELLEARKTLDGNYFFCREFNEAGEKGYCGKQCLKYEPRNGKSGICKHTGQLYEQTENKFILKLT